MAQAAEEFAQEVAAIEAKHAAELQALIKQKEEEIQVTELSIAMSAFTWYTIYLYHSMYLVNHLNKNLVHIIHHL